MSVAQPSLLPGQSAPVAIITTTDKRGEVLIVTALGLAFALCSLLIRAYVRHEFGRNKFGWDDLVIGVAMIFSILQNVAVFVGVSKGFGLTIDDISTTNLVALQKALYSSDILYIITLWLTKCSVASLFLRLSPNKRHVLLSRIAILITAVTAFTSILTITLRCNLAHPWIDIGTKCTGLFARWQTITAFDIIIEILLGVISVYMIQSLQMSLSKKLIIISAFALRLPIIAAGAFRLHYVSRTLHSTDPTLAGVLVTVCTQVEIAYGIIAATIPCLQPFMTATATNYGAPATDAINKSGSSYGREVNSKSNNSSSKKNGSKAGISLASLSSQIRSTSSRLSGRVGAEKGSDQSSAAFGGSGQFNTMAMGRPRRASTSMSSTGSKRMIIRKDMEYTVRHEDRVARENQRGMGYAV